MSFFDPLSKSQHGVSRRPTMIGRKAESEKNLQILRNRASETLKGSAGASNSNNGFSSALDTFTNSLTDLANNFFDPFSTLQQQRRAPQTPSPPPAPQTKERLSLTVSTVDSEEEEGYNADSSPSPTTESNAFSYATTESTLSPYATTTDSGTTSAYGTESSIFSSVESSTTTSTRTPPPIMGSDASAFAQAPHVHRPVPLISPSGSMEDLQRPRNSSRHDHHRNSNRHDHHHRGSSVPPDRSPSQEDRRGRKEEEEMARTRTHRSVPPNRNRPSPEGHGGHGRQVKSVRPKQVTPPNGGSPGQRNRSRHHQGTPPNGTTHGGSPSRAKDGKDSEGHASRPDPWGSSRKTKSSSPIRNGDTPPNAATAPSRKPKSRDHGGIPPNEAAHHPEPTKSSPKSHARHHQNEATHGQEPTKSSPKSHARHHQNEAAHGPEPTKSSPKYHARHHQNEATHGQEPTKSSPKSHARHHQNEATNGQERTKSSQKLTSRDSPPDQNGHGHSHHEPTRSSRKLNSSRGRAQETITPPNETAHGHSHTEPARSSRKLESSRDSPPDKPAHGHRTTKASHHTLSDAKEVMLGLSLPPDKSSRRRKKSDAFVGNLNRRWSSQRRFRPDDDASLLTTCAGTVENFPTSMEVAKPVDVLKQLIRAPCGAMEGVGSYDDSGASSATSFTEDSYSSVKRGRSRKPRTPSPTPTLSVARTVSTDDSGTRDKNFIQKFIEEMCHDGVLLIWHGPDQNRGTTFQRPCGVVSYLNLGSPQADGVYDGPRLVWRKQDGSEGGVIDLFDIQSMDTASSELFQDRYHFAIPENSFVIRLSPEKHVVFEASSAAEACRFIHGLRWVVARLSFNLVVGNPLVSCELLSVAGIAHGRMSVSPQSPMEEALWSKAMNDVTNHLVDKSVAQSSTTSPSPVTEKMGGEKYKTLRL